MTGRTTSLILAILASGGIAAAQVPFGGDETGCLPSDADAAKCEAAMSKALAKAAVCILACHRNRAVGKLADEADVERCERSHPTKSCKAKYDKATGAANKIDALCPPCLDAARRAAEFEELEASLDARNGNLFCCPAAATTTTVSTTSTTTPITSTTSTTMPTGDVPCYGGPPNTAGVGLCRAGVAHLVGGGLGPCVGEVRPSQESCNGEDDDCNGTADDGLGTITCGLGACRTTVPACVNGMPGSCLAPTPGTSVDGPACNGIDDDCDGAVDEDCHSCIPVSLGGNDATADGTFPKPFRTIQAAIDWAASHSGPKTVCVAAGPACGSVSAPVTGTYASASGVTITMSNGISVLGNYESTGWNRCASSTTTVIQPGTAAGMTFPSAVQSPTVLDGFRIDRAASPTTAGVTVDGAGNVLLSNLAIMNMPSVTSSYGVNVINGGAATIARSRIDAGTGASESIGVRSIGSQVRIEDNCQSLNANGRCDDFCTGNPSIRGRTTSGSGVTYAVLLQDSPGSVVQQSALCTGDADQAAMVRIGGDGTGIVIRGNTISAFGGATDSHGVWMEDCGGAAPWIVDNQSVVAAGDSANTRVDAIRAIGDCHPLIDHNVLIGGGGEGVAASPNGVHCGANPTGTASRCVVDGNTLITGSTVGFPPTAVGIRCEAGGCARIAGNGLVSGRGGVIAIGIVLDRSGPFVDANVIEAGCGTNDGTGVLASDSFARLQNNLIFGATCPMTSIASSNAVRVLLSAGRNEVDLHSNDLFAAGKAGPCISRALAFDVRPGGAPDGPRGLVRNDILDAGLCNTSMDVAELNAMADPRVLQNNDFSPAPVLYRDENTTNLTTAAQVNAMSDTTAAGNISADPLLASGSHLTAGSPCRNAGISSEAPTTDFDGDSRPAEGTDDIGADEFVP